MGEGSRALDFSRRHFADPNHPVPVFDILGQQESRWRGSKLSGLPCALAGPRFCLHRCKSLSSHAVRELAVGEPALSFTGEETEARGGQVAFVKPPSPVAMRHFCLRPHVLMAPRFAF